MHNHLIRNSITLNFRVIQCNLSSIFYMCIVVCVSLLGVARIYFALETTKCSYLLPSYYLAHKN